MDSRRLRPQWGWTPEVEQLVCFPARYLHLVIKKTRTTTTWRARSIPAERIALQGRHGFVKDLFVTYRVLMLALLFAATTAPARQPAAPVAGTSTAMVSAADRRAADAGVTMLRQGGSAFDAAAATLIALGVVEPQSSGIGGGAFLVYQPATGLPATFDGRETAPQAATPALFLGPDGKPLPKGQMVPGGKSVGVPGNIAMLALGHAKYGKLAWRALFQPAIALARDGYDISPRMADAIASKKDVLAHSPQAAALYLLPDGSPKPVGTHIINEPLARTLEDIAAHGPSGFYAGANADALVKTVTTAWSNPSSMTRADVAAYHAHERPAVCQTYRVWKVCGMGPPSAGGVAVIAILKQLEGFNLAKMGANDPVAWHLLAESERLAFADRNTYLADSDFITVPVKGLISTPYLRSRGRLISASATMATVAAGTPPGAPPRAMVPNGEIPSTSAFSAVDAHGNAASVTSTVEGGFGSGLVSGGYVLNNELTDFTFAPVEDGALVANRVQGGKRPRSSMAPTIVYDAKGRVVLVVGAAGGPTIPAQVAKTIIGVLDWQLPVQAAIALPVMMVFDSTVLIESGPQGAPLAAMQPALKALGHSDIKVYPLPYKANGIERIGTAWRGGADPRSEGVAVGL
jgi:gamma-glutamyltranspeptidase / glutathione hydrolase